VSSASEAWHIHDTATVCRRLDTTPQGLAAAEAARRLAVVGPNMLQAEARATVGKLLLAQFQNVLVVILLIGTALSALMGHPVEALAIAVIVLFSVLLGFAQEFRTERALEALRRMAAPTAQVVRDGQVQEVPMQHLVPGDLLVLHPGDKVGADVRLLEAINLQLEEAALTGESVPVAKHTAALADATLPVPDRHNMAYAGTTVVYGRGQGVVVATGMQTEFGAIARLLQTVAPGRTPLQLHLDQAGRLLARGALAVVALVVILGLLRGQAVVDMLLFGIALAVAVVPEALPAVVTISLAIGVQRMVRRQALIRRLPAVETLGSTSIICSDKTGTLTRDEMTVRKVLVDETLLDVTGSGYDPVGAFVHAGQPVEPSPLLLRLLQTAALASDATLRWDVDAQAWQTQGDPTERALVVAAAKAGLWKTDLDGDHPRIHEVPFTAESKRMTTVHDGPGGWMACAKGAPEILLTACTHRWTHEGIVSLEDAAREHVLAQARQMAGEALRVLAIAIKPTPTLADAEQGMTFLGLVGLIDPPRPEARAAVETCRAAGIRVVMITGDHPLTAAAIARELGIDQGGRVVTGVELEHLSDAELAAAVGKTTVYARVSPAHKLRVVTALQQQGHIVAMTGDGVNDAPALKKADIGIAMGQTGTSVTKEASAMTLLDDNFASIVAAVEEGRGIYSNIKKYLMYLLSSNIGEIGLMLGAALAGWPLPLSAVQLLYVNLATDGLPALALAVDPPEDDLMRRTPRDPRAGIFSRPVVLLMLAGGLWSMVVNLGLFAWALHAGYSLVQAMTLTFLSLALIQFFKAYSFRSDYHTVLHQPFANRWLNAAIAFEVATLLLIVYVPALNTLFGTYPLTGKEWLVVVLGACSVVPVLEAVKALLRRARR
jgi:Ca2+-transporting ATPase